MANELVTKVINRIGAMQKEQGLSLPAGYSASNALNYAWLQLSDTSKGKSLLDKTSPESQTKALLNMVIQGLSPAKNQVYFIPYGNQLTLTRSYFGSLAILKRLENVNDVWAEVVHEGDVFEIGSERGRTIVRRFNPKFENQDKPIIGAYAVIENNKRVLTYTIMTKKEIDQSWSHARTDKVQNEFPQEMAKRTVLNRAAKYFINSSSDNDLLIGAINDTTANEYDDNDKQPAKDVTPTNIDDLLEGKEPEVAPAPETGEEATADGTSEQDFDDFIKQAGEPADEQNPFD